MGSASNGISIPKEGTPFSDGKFGKEGLEGPGI